MEQVGHDLHQPGRIALDVKGFRRQSNGQLVPGFLNGRLAGVHGVVERRGQVHTFLAQVDLAA